MERMDEAQRAVFDVLYGKKLPTRKRVEKAKSFTTFIVSVAEIGRQDAVCRANRYPQIVSEIKKTFCDPEDAEARDNLIQLAKQTYHDAFAYAKRGRGKKR
jgi:hypothetical protein